MGADIQLSLMAVSVWKGRFGGKNSAVDMMFSGKRDRRRFTMRWKRILAMIQ
jgi:hypothetical protein